MKSYFSKMTFQGLSIRPQCWSYLKGKNNKSSKKSKSANGNHIVELEEPLEIDDAAFTACKEELKEAKTKIEILTVSETTLRDELARLNEDLAAGSENIKALAACQTELKDANIRIENLSISETILKEELVSLNEDLSLGTKVNFKSFKNKSG